MMRNEKINETIFLAGCMTVTLALSIIFSMMFMIEYALGIDEVSGVKSLIMVSLAFMTLWALVYLKRKYDNLVKG